MTSADTRARSTETGGDRRVLELEGLRAVAAGAVVLTHAGFMSGAIGRDILPGFLARMDIGVAVFFVLSGFLLYRPHARANAGHGMTPAVRTFLIRRTARLVPAWLLALIGTAVLVPKARSATGEVWIANLLQLQSLKQEWLLPGMAQLWSLSTELMFYLALPLIAFVISRITKGRPAWLELLTLATVVVLAQTFRALTEAGAFPNGFSWLQTLPATMDWFSGGMVLAVLTAHPGRWNAIKLATREAPYAPWIITGCLLWVLTTRLAGPYDLSQPSASEQTFKHIGYGLVAVLVVLPSVLGARSVIGDMLSSSVMSFLGRISYGVFLWHLPIMFAVHDGLGFEIFDGHFWITLLGTFAVTIPVAALSWRWVEAPIQRWAHARTSSSPVTKPSSPTHA